MDIDDEMDDEMNNLDDPVVYAKRLKLSGIRLSFKDFMDSSGLSYYRAAGKFWLPAYESKKFRKAYKVNKFIFHARYMEACSMILGERGEPIFPSQEECRAYYDRMFEQEKLMNLLIKSKPNLGQYGKMRLEFLKDHSRNFKRNYFDTLLETGKLWSHIEEFNEVAYDLKYKTFERLRGEDPNFVYRVWNAEAYKPDGVDELPEFELINETIQLILCADDEHPDPEIPESLGYYGLFRLSFLRYHCKDFFFSLLETGKLWSHLEEIQEEASGMVERIVAQNPPPASEANPAGYTNMTRSRAEEIVNKEIVYREAQYDDYDDDDDLDPDSDDEPPFTFNLDSTLSEVHRDREDEDGGDRRLADFSDFPLSGPGFETYQLGPDEIPF